MTQNSACNRRWTLLERWDEFGTAVAALRPDEIRRALAESQAAKEWLMANCSDGGWIMRRADELLGGGK